MLFPFDSHFSTHKAFGGEARKSIDKNMALGDKSEVVQSSGKNVEFLFFARVWTAD